MPRLRRLLTRVRPGRRSLAAGLAGVYLVACGGLPVPSPGTIAGGPFPCAGRGCGCGTADACWVGACCCFTAREKLAWAVAHDFTPPAHFLRAVEREAADAECPHCAAEKGCSAAPPRSVDWLVGVSALTCKGGGHGGPVPLPPAVPAPVVVLAAPLPAPFARPTALAPVLRPAVPPVPPPRPV